MQRTVPWIVVATVWWISAWSEDRLPFAVRVIDPDNSNSSVAVLDVDRDGDLDLIAGGRWYAAPDWTPRPVREVEVIRGRQDNYSSLLLDVDADGQQDLVSANYRSESLYWVRNPGPAAALSGVEWPRNVIERPGPMETGRLADVDGDGVNDLLPNGVNFAGWWSLRAGAQPVWERHPLPEELAGHGMGFGDVNGDGRSDVVGPRGWAEAPADRRRERWVFHAEFDLWNDASIPIGVLDVDSDGDADLVWGRGHQIGLWWLEQISDSADGRRRWQKHAIDSQTGQNHSLLTADLDGNGRLEVIAGTRDRGHDGRDIGEWAPLEIASCEFIPESRTWQRRLISRSRVVASGVDPQAVDVDGDGDVDLVVADQRGLYLLENQLRNSSRPSTPSQPAVLDLSITADSYRHSDLMTVQVSEAPRSVTSPELAALRREHSLAGMSLAMGSLPSAARRSPLDMQVLSEEDRGTYVEQRISFVPEPGDRVPALLLLPKKRRIRTPAMLCLHQTTGIGKGEPAGHGGLPNLHYAKELAEEGFICLAPDYPSFGEYTWDFGRQGTAAGYVSGSMKAIWNNIRAVDLLQTLPDVDPDRIGCIGHSLGGHNALFTAAFDQRLRAVVTSCGFTAFHSYYGGKLGGWTSDRYMPRIRDLYGNDPNQVPFDFHEVLAAIAPRAVFVSAPLHDDNFDHEGVLQVVAEAGRVYEVFGAPKGTLRLASPDCAHDFPPAVREEVRNWLRDQLQFPR
ncbi:MAG: hypothetical protein RL215_2219 [Planctomycetota bacterium]